jgi:hypothetical protein
MLSEYIFYHTEYTYTERRYAVCRVVIIILGVTKLNVVILSVLKLNAIVLNAVKLSVVTSIVMAPIRHLSLTYLLKVQQNLLPNCNKQIIYR